MSKVWTEFAERLKRQVLKLGGQPVSAAPVGVHHAEWKCELQNEHGTLIATVQPAEHSVRVFLQGGMVARECGFYTPHDRKTLPKFCQIIQQSLEDLVLKPFKPALRHGKHRTKLAAFIRQIRCTWHDFGEQRTKNEVFVNPEWSALYDRIRKLYPIAYPRCSYDAYERAVRRAEATKASRMRQHLHSRAWTADDALSNYGGEIVQAVPAIMFFYPRAVRLQNDRVWLPDSDVPDFNTMAAWYEQRKGKLTEWTWRPGMKEAKGREYCPRSPRDGIADIRKAFRSLAPINQPKLFDKMTIPEVIAANHWAWTEGKLCATCKKPFAKTAQRGNRHGACRSCGCEQFDYCDKCRQPFERGRECERCKVRPSAYAESA